MIRINCKGVESYGAENKLLHVNALVIICIHVINFKVASGRFFIHFLEVFEKCIDYIRIFFIHFL